MSFFSVKFEGIDSLINAVKELQASVGPSVVEALAQACDEVIVPQIQSNIIEEHLVFRGELLDKIGVRVITDGEDIEVVVGAIDVPYAAAVELGQEPGTEQDLDTLVEYAAVKLGYVQARAEEVGFLLKQSIEELGTQPHPFVMPAFDEKSGQLFTRFVELVRAKLHLD